MKAINRLFSYLEYKDIPHTRYEKDVGLSNGYLKTQLRREADLGESIFTRVLNNSLDINPTWLLTGEGEMLKENVKINSNNNTISKSKNLENVNQTQGNLNSSSGSESSKDMEIDFLKRENESLKEQVEYFKGLLDKAMSK
ncbi:hypothetical protein V9L05_18190 [Bernardetia sp. Wsw4-3y2]|uniref:hypothetical protein n=1 Tax=Bernardetia sp. Wsw4-3y2 TaxID=3127471 RepID=UPI0030D46DB8